MPRLGMNKQPEKFSQEIRNYILGVAFQIPVKDILYLLGEKGGHNEDYSYVDKNLIVGLAFEFFPKGHAKPKIKVRQVAYTSSGHVFDFHGGIKGDYILGVEKKFNGSSLHDIIKGTSGASPGGYWSDWNEPVDINDRERHGSFQLQFNELKTDFVFFTRDAIMALVSSWKATRIILSGSSIEPGIITKPHLPEDVEFAVPTFTMKMELLDPVFPKLVDERGRDVTPAPSPMIIYGQPCPPIWNHTSDLLRQIASNVLREELQKESVDCPHAKFGEDYVNKNDNAAKIRAGWIKAVEERKTGSTA
ncbi:MAG: hypothetical protein AAFZ15_02120 [Bacteroidota bacterium]